MISLAFKIRTSAQISPLTYSYRSDNLKKRTTEREREQSRIVFLISKEFLGIKNEHCFTYLSSKSQSLAILSRVAILDRKDTY